MPKSSRRDGRNICGLAINRKIDAVISFAFAGLLI